MAIRKPHSRISVQERLDQLEAQQNALGVAIDMLRREVRRQHEQERDRVIARPTKGRKR